MINYNFTTKSFDEINTAASFKLHVTTKHTGKMQYLQSLSTSSLVNPFCIARSKNNNMICSKCYSNTMQARYKNLSKTLERNAVILTGKILDIDDLPVINCLLFRFEAFGDLINKTQFINYLNICNKNKSTSFAIWTKNYNIIKSVFNDGYEKPDNLLIIFSSPYLNDTVNLDFNQEYNFVDKVFTVYDKEYIKNNNININCGARDCFTCRKCYTQNDTFYINEMLK